MIAQKNFGGSDGRIGPLGHGAARGTLRSPERWLRLHTCATQLGIEAEDGYGRGRFCGSVDRIVQRPPVPPCRPLSDNASPAQRINC